MHITYECRLNHVTLQHNSYVLQRTCYAHRFHAMLQAQQEKTSQTSATDICHAHYSSLADHTLHYANQLQNIFFHIHQLICCGSMPNQVFECQFSVYCLFKHLDQRSITLFHFAPELARVFVKCRNQPFLFVEVKS